MTNIWIAVFLILHLLICIVLYVLHKLAVLHTKAQLFPFVFCLPVCGPCLILIEEWYERKQKMGIDEIGVEKLKIEDEIYKRIDVDASKDSNSTVPLEEALVIDDTKTRRKLMMDILNRDPKQYIRLLQKIRMSSDTEITHYATTSMAEIQRNHATCTGYAGILGSMAKWKTGKPFIVTEHGIYTREREEELLRAEWVLSYFKDMWINLFYQFSSCAYHYSDKVTCLFEHAAETQRELGCDASKQMVIENGIHYEKFCDIPVKQENGKIEIAAVVRLARIKDIKTMIYAFMEVKAKIPEAVLYIMGDADDEEYAQECRNLVDQLNIKDLIFTGNVNIMEYFPHLDFTILASISEGQPLSVLESLAAGRPCVTTDVGCCRELLEGKQGDTFGIAGYCVPPMHVDMLAGAMISMCRNRQLRLKMGEAGRQRVKAYYTHEISMDKYRRLYQEVL